MHRSGHRPERDGARGRELSELKKEVQQLRRQVARLQKRNEQLESDRHERGQALEEEGAAPLVLTTEERCACGGSFSTFTTPNGKVLKVCKACKHRTL